MKLKSTLFPLGLVLALSSFVFATQNTQEISSKANCKPKCCNTKKCNSDAMAKKHHKKKFEPFLIVSEKMPHLTKLIKQNWNNKELNLVGNQKKELLEVRQGIVTSMKDLSPRIEQLEKDITFFTNRNESKNDIFQMVKDLARLKAEATQAHIECIRDTKDILTQKQFDFLTK